jgi:hypothetical protein
MLDEPGGLVANPQVAHQLERRDVVLGLGQQVHGQEPARQPHLVASKIVPLMTLHWWRQAAHWKYSRPSRRNELWWPQPHSGQTKPAGQREAISAASHLSSLP